MFLFFLQIFQLLDMLKTIARLQSNTIKYVQPLKYIHISVIKTNYCNAKLTKKNNAEESLKYPADAIVVSIAKYTTMKVQKNCI